ncbi:MAG: FMN-binding glutamate synthase family protein [Myxococcales bacterium]|nr:FMN-binding glutamate synthase family protein [Myxococcales bacterium]
MFLVPPLVLLCIWFLDQRQDQHAVLRNFPLLGRIRYLLEHIGPELRQYLFDGDREGKPFSRDEYGTVVFAGKYLKTLVSFGSKRNFEAPGWYLRNALLATLADDVATVLEPKIATHRYVIDDEGLFSRRERIETVEVSPWTLADPHKIVIGADLDHPWTLSGQVGMSAMSYGALGRNAIQALSHGLADATGSWMNTGEGGISPHHLVGGGDVVYQIGPGMFGVRTLSGEWDWNEFVKKAAIPELRGFELKIHQGAKIRGGHVEGSKVNEEIAALRGVPVGQTIDSPNRFAMFGEVDDILDWVARMRAESGKPVGLKVVVGGPGSLDELAAAIAWRGNGPDWLTVDGGEGGSGATYREMADTMGLPIRSGLIEADDALRRAGVRDRVRIFASGKLFSPDAIALALCTGADAVNVARGLMISVGCIQAQKCHTNACPVGVATTDEKFMRGLVVQEKRWRVLNYVVTLRAGLNSLAAAAGLTSPTGFRRHHAIYKDAHGRSRSAAELFPVAEAGDATPTG